MFCNFFLKKIALYCYFLCSFQYICQFVNRKSDRIQISYVTITSMGKGTLNFSPPFVNPPKIVYNIMDIEFVTTGSVRFNIGTQSSTTNQVIYYVSGSPNDFTSLRVGILATDYPNQIYFTGAIQPGQVLTKTIPSNMIGYCKYISGFQGKRYGNISLGLTSSYSGNTFSISSINGSMSFVFYDILIFYESPSPKTLLYTFKMQNDQRSGSTAFGFVFDTGVPSYDNIFYGLIQWETTVVASATLSIKIPSHILNTSPYYISILMDFSTSGALSAWMESITLFIRYCPPGNFIIYQGSDYQCTSDCTSINSQTYNDSVNTFPMDYPTYIMHPCSPCSSGCYGCTGPNNNQCTSCTTGKYLIISTSTCVISQPASSYCPSQTIDSQNYFKCQTCDSTCLTCSGTSANQCTSCKSANPYLYNGRCFNSQPSTTYCPQLTVNSIINYNCSPCYSKCYSCQGSSMNQCTSCLSANPYLFNGQCLPTQPSSSYCTTASKDTQSYNDCQSCYSTCSTCNGVSSNQCMSCTSSFPYLFNGNCLSSQPAQTYCTNTNINSQTFQNCQSCNSTCQTCSGSAANQCTSCTSSYQYRFNGSCSSSQPIKTFCLQTTINSIINYNCSPCDPSCYLCSGSSNNQCTQCFSTLPYLYNGQCLTSQLIQTACTTISLSSFNYYSCQNCYSTCYTRSGTAQNQCTSCISTHPYLYQGSCLNSQPAQTYCPITTTGSQNYYNCQPCYFTCETCSGLSSNQCTICLYSYPFQYLGSCTNTIPSSTYCTATIINSLTYYNCQPCYASCYDCSGIANNQCTSCVASAPYFFNNSCYSSQPASTYCITANTNYECFNCHATCKTCSGGNSNECTSCWHSNPYLYNGLCVDNTISGVYCDINTQMCQTCIVNNCFRCDSTLLNCDECLSGYFNYY